MWRAVSLRTDSPLPRDTYTTGAITGDCTVIAAYSMITHTIDATHLVAEANEENNNVASGPIP